MATGSWITPSPIRTDCHVGGKMHRVWKCLSRCATSLTACAALSLPAATVEVGDFGTGTGRVEWSQRFDPDGSAVLDLKAIADGDSAFSGWIVDGFAPDWSVDARNPSLSGVRVASNAVVKASFADRCEDTLWFDVAGELSYFECGENVEVRLDVDSVSYPSLSFQGLPEGLSYDSKTLTVSGVVKTPCYTTVLVSGKNESGFKFRQQFHSTVGDASTDRLSGGASEMLLGDYFHAEFEELFVVDGVRVSTIVSGVPQGMTWKEDWDVLYGTPRNAGVYIIKAKALFLDGTSDEATFRLTVSQPDPSEYGVSLDGLSGLFVGDVLEPGDVELGTYENRAGITSVSGLPPGLSVQTWSDAGVKHFGVVGTVREAGVFTVSVGVVDNSGQVASSVMTAAEVAVSDTPSRYFKVRVSDLSPEGSGTVSGGGAIPVFSGATAKATASGGYVFAGWLDQDGYAADVGDGVDYRNPSIAYAADAQLEYMELYALFVPSEQDAELSISGLDGVSIEFDADGALDEEFSVESASLPTLAASGLPAGVSIMPGAGSSYRIAYDGDTAAKRPSPGRYQVTLAAKNKSGASVSVEFPVTVGNLSDARIDVEDDYGEFPPGEEIVPIDLSEAVDFSRGETISVSGLPRGLTYNKSANLKKGIEARTITGVPTAPGYYTLTFTAKVVASETTNSSGRVARVYDTAKATAFMTVLPYPLLSIDVEDEALEAGNSVVGEGNYKPGTKVSLKAKAAKGWVFAGWEGLWDVDGLSLLNPTVSVTTDSYDLDLSATFVPLSEDALSIVQPMLTDAGFAAEFELGSDVAAGEYSDLVLDLLETVSYPSVKVSGLPAGVKFSSSDLRLSGKPTKKGVYYATVSATNAGGYSFTRILRLAVLEPGGDPPEEEAAENSAQIDFSPLEGLVTGTYCAKGERVLDIAASPASGAAPVQATVSGAPAGLVAHVEQAGERLAVSFVGTPTKVARYAVSVKVTYADKKSLSSKAYVIVEDGGSAYIDVASFDESLGTVKGGGVYSSGATVKLVATPKSKCVFAGWVSGADVESAVPFAPLSEIDGVDFRTASVSFPFRPADFSDAEVLWGAFAAAADDDSVSLCLDGPVWNIDHGAASEFLFAADSLSLPKISAKGLPGGVAVDLARGRLVYTPSDSTKSGVYKATLTAKNQSSAVDTAALEVRVANRVSPVIEGLDPDMDAYCLHAGVSLDSALIAPVVATEDGWKLSASGLPAGLKFVQDKDTGRYSVVGVSTAKSGAYTVTFTASKKGEKNQIATVTLNVEALPEWAVGTFEGAVAGAQGQPAGSVSFTVSSSGKISGKMLEGGRTWTLSASSFGSVVDGMSFVATVLAKSGKETVTNEVSISAESVLCDDAGSLCQRGVAQRAPLPDPDAQESDSLNWTAWQNLWKAEPWKSIAKPFGTAGMLVLYVVENDAEGYVVLDEAPESVSEYDTITLKFASSGAVNATGKFFTGYDVKTGRPKFCSSTCASVLTPVRSDDKCNNYGVNLYFAPNSSGFKGRSLRLVVEWLEKKFLLHK